MEDTTLKKNRKFCLQFFINDCHKLPIFILFRSTNNLFSFFRCFFSYQYWVQLQSYLLMAISVFLYQFYCSLNEVQYILAILYSLLFTMTSIHLKKTQQVLMCQVYWGTLESDFHSKKFSPSKRFAVIEKGKNWLVQRPD